MVLSVRLMQKTCEACPKRAECGGCPNLPILQDIVSSNKSIAELINKHRQDGRAFQRKQYLNLSEALKDDGQLKLALLEIGKEAQLNITLVNQLPENTHVSFFDIEKDGRQLLSNLFFNARKANASAMRIVGVDFEDHVAIHFIDDGDGMPQTTIQCLGLPSASKTSTGEGTNIIKKLVLKNGGAIDWMSAGKGSGCCVTLRLEKVREIC